MKLTLTRVAYTDDGVFGTLAVEDGPPFALTLERPWLNNRPSRDGIPGSCIPSGAWMCERVQSPKFGNTFEVTRVPNRSAILFHKGNLADDSRGCILVGEQFEHLNGKPGIIASAHGFAEFLRLTADVATFSLTIRNAEGT